MVSHIYGQSHCQHYNNQAISKKVLISDATAQRRMIFTASASALGLAGYLLAGVSAGCLGVLSRRKLALEAEKTGF